MGPGRRAALVVFSAARLPGTGFALGAETTQVDLLSGLVKGFRRSRNVVEKRMGKEDEERTSDMTLAYIV